MRSASLFSLQVLLLAAIGCRATDKPGETGDTGDTGDTGQITACENAESILLENGEPSGFERCEDFAVNRVEAVAVEAINPNEGCRGTEDEFRCTTDDECGDGPNGFCAHTPDYGDGGFPNGVCSCEYTCASDADCEADEACIAHEATEGATRPTCEPAECRTGDDCASGECGLSDFDNGCGWDSHLRCRDASIDACHGTGDCPQADQAMTCAVENTDEGFQCLTPSCDIGRPLIVQGAGRVARAETRADWSESRARGEAGSGDASAVLDAELRVALATHYRTVAALEHASVGSFARFTLQLLAIGAPPELLLATQEAAADEVRHAQAMYALASRFGDAPVGPGPLPLQGAMPALSVEGIVAGLIDEACIGETLGAAEAAACAESTSDPAIRAVLLTIAADEARHAALAWKSLRWILGAHPEAADFARQRFDAAVAEHAARLARGARTLDAAAWGMPSDADRRAVQRAALDRVVRAVGSELFGASA